MIPHFYQSIDGWFNMEEQYKKLLDHVPINGTFIELGCYKGKSSAFLLTELANSGLKKDIIIIDNFVGSENTKVEREVYKNAGNFYEQFMTNIEPVSQLLKGVFALDSAEAAELFEDKSIDVIFIDAGHSYQNVYCDITAWLPKMKKDGIMAGHDYNESWPGVIKAVNELLGEEHITVENSCWFYKV